MVIINCVNSWIPLFWPLFAWIARYYDSALPMSTVMRAIQANGGQKEVNVFTGSNSCELVELKTELGSIHSSCETKKSHTKFPQAKNSFQVFKKTVACENFLSRKNKNWFCRWKLFPQKNHFRMRILFGHARTNLWHSIARNGKKIVSTKTIFLAESMPYLYRIDHWYLLPKKIFLRWIFEFFTAKK